MDFDAVLLLSFGGPEGPEQVRPFLENVTRGRNVPPERLDDVAEHYQHFGGVSPINGINRALIAQLEAEFATADWTCRCISATATGSRMSKKPSRRCATTVFVALRCSPHRPGAGIPAAHNTSKTSPGPAQAAGRMRPSWSSCDLLRPSAVGRDVRRGHRRGRPARGLRADARLVFTAHSIPVAADRRCGPQLYSRQVAYADKAGRGGRRVLRLRPGLAVPIGSAAGALAGARCRRPAHGAGTAGTKAVIVCPIGFVADHIEVVWDLDEELRSQAEAAGMAFARATTPNADRRFARLAADLIDELRYGRTPARVVAPIRCRAAWPASTARRARPPHCVARDGG